MSCFSLKGVRPAYPDFFVRSGEGVGLVRIGGSDNPLLAEREDDFSGLKMLCEGDLEGDLVAVWKRPRVVSPKVWP